MGWLDDDGVDLDGLRDRYGAVCALLGVVGHRDGVPASLVVRTVALSTSAADGPGVLEELTGVLDDWAGPLQSVFFVSRALFASLDAAALADQLASDPAPELVGAAAGMLEFSVAEALRAGERALAGTVEGMFASLVASGATPAAARLAVLAATGTAPAV